MGQAVPMPPGRLSRHPTSDSWSRQHRTVGVLGVLCALDPMRIHFISPGAHTHLLVPPDRQSTDKDLHEEGHQKCEEV